jgi:hypothetical protein
LVSLFCHSILSTRYFIEHISIFKKYKKHLFGLNSTFIAPDSFRGQVAEAEAAAEAAAWCRYRGIISQFDVLPYIHEHRERPAIHHRHNVHKPDLFR